MRLFQSTPPVKAATRTVVSPSNSRGISIHAAREGGDDVVDDLKRQLDISIHAAREGGDSMLYAPVEDACISIHAAREGGDAIIAAIDTP